MSRKLKKPERLKSHKEKTSLGQKWLWLKLQAGRFFWDYHGLQDDIGHWVVKHEKKIKKWLIIIGILLAAIAVFGWLGGSLLDAVTVYKNGIPVSGPGANAAP